MVKLNFEKLQQKMQFLVTVYKLKQLRSIDPKCSVDKGTKYFFNLGMREYENVANYEI